MSISYQFLLFAVTGLAFVESSETSSEKTTCVPTTDVQIKNGPLITPSVTEIILQKGQNFTLTCKGATELKFRQQEVSEEVTSNFTIVNTSSCISEKEYSFQRTLDLYNVDQYAIGYYACSDDYVDDNVVNTITEEPENDEHVSYIYVYVNGTDSLFAPMRELIISKSNKILIECRPTTPDVEVKLYPDIAEYVFSPKVGFTFNYVVDTRLNSFSCDFRTKDRTRMIRKAIYVQRVTGPPEPIVTDETINFLKGEELILNCTAQLQLNNIVTLSWKLPKGLHMDEVDYKEENNSNITEGTLYKCLKIYNASKKHEGNYTCVSRSNCEFKESKVVMTNLTKPFLNVTLLDPVVRGLTRQAHSSTRFEVRGYPKPTYKILKNGNEVPIGTGKYSLTYKEISKYFVLTVKSLDVTDNGNYTLVANNGFLESNDSFKLEVGASPVIDFGKGNKSCVKGMDTNLKCDVTGYPLPEITWRFTYDDKNVLMNSTDLVKTSDYKVTAYLNFKQCIQTGTITCIAGKVGLNKVGNSNVSRGLVVYDIIGGFGIDTDSNNTDSPKVKWFLEKNKVTVKCFASRYKFNNVTWLLNDKDTRKTVEYSNSSKFSYVAELKINGISKNHAGNFSCIGVKNDGTKVFDSIQINVYEIRPPVIIDAEEVNKDVFRFEPTTHLNCIVTGAPLPEVKWLKEGQPLENYNQSNIYILNNNVNLTMMNSTVIINIMQPDNVGKYECVAKSNITTLTKSFSLKLKVEVEETNKKHYVIGITAILLILIVLIVYLTLKMKKEKRLRKELMAAGLWDFKHPLLTTSLNPELGIDEQAELLPYDEKFEFPPEKLVLGKQLGAGAFGVVYKGEARGIVNAEETTPVAVKMVKKTAENMYIKALASELKIMVHLGKHINIVNLLGACTKNVAKRELLVIVEYCKYGNIHNYMQRHREVFIDQLDTDNKEKLGKVNRAYTSSSCGSTGAPSDYFGSTNTRNTDHTFLNTENTAHSARKNIPNNNLPMEEIKASEGYVQPEWRSNYESDYSYDGRSPRPLTSRDLLAWAFQIARGMEYLASRKVMHGDLAARNVLLADDNVVKICDFGLAKSIYKNDEYQKKENSPLPVKWLAIECMTDGIFSTQSDVWSFGIVMWEIFTLAKTPYPNIPHTSLLQFLSEGHRLDKPVHADDKLYDVMKKCWEAKPTLRPTFSQLQEKLGTFLEDNVREHYVDLNSTYDAKNAFSRGQSDYLDMIRAPDYNNMVTPSPHHYVNANDKSFFPQTPAKVDEEGYLQISPANQGNFSPRVPNTEFDFDPRKFNSKASEASCGSELTPMLTLNNLPARSGSESDHEGNPPYLNACPRIDEEADEVFAPSLNDTKNAKNMQQSAVTNPTYITFDNFDEKPKDIINSYVNINMPNGLVK